MTRAVNSLKTALVYDSVKSETIADLFEKVTSAFEAVESAHCSLIEQIDDGEEYEKEEKWMEEVQSTFLEVRLLTESFLRDNLDKQVGSTVKVRDENKESSKTTGLSDSNENKQPLEAARQHSGESDEASEASSNVATANRLSDFNEIKLALELPKAEYAKFNGNPIEYYSFMSNFEVNIESKLTSNPTRLQHLKTMCTSKARSYIECCDLLGDSGYGEAKRILKMQFGQPHMILNSLMRELTDRQPIRPNDSDSLWDLIASMKKCHVTLTKLGYTGDLNSTSNLLKVQDLLPTHLQSAWVNNAHDILTKEKREPTFNDLLGLLVRHAEVSSTMFGKYLAQSRSSNNRKRQGQGHVNVRSNHISSKPIKCFICDGEHKIYTCKEFLADVKGSGDVNVDPRSIIICFTLLLKR
ncbi:uncharacterized protein [Apostichopus japonicus]|uniref:uncharacterized protein n=1 Tax=Stichopus japonicus TaxID=307972 RepID=UPI003AB52738